MTLQTVIEEECSGNGALACLDAGYDADAVLIPEPFNLTILTQEVGVLWFRVDVSGVASHVLDTQAGSNAVEKMYPIIHALRELEKEMNAQAASRRLRTHRQSAQHEYRHHEGRLLALHRTFQRRTALPHGILPGREL